MAAQVRKAEDAAVAKWCFAGIITSLFLTISAHAQTVPGNGLQANLNTYFDSFNVQVIYPSLSVTRKISESTSINARYLVDLVTAASIRSSVVSDNAIVRSASGEEDDDGRGQSNRVDGITAASSGGRYEGIGYNPDDVRHQLGFGVTQAFGGGAVALNGIYSKESDYRSGTVAGTYSRSLFMNNTSVQLGMVRSWDANSPKVFNWTKNKNNISYSANVTQIWTKRLISQAIYSYIRETGLLSNPYEVVTIKQGNETLRLEPAEPDLRIRQAFGTKVNFKLKNDSALHLGLRYYWDNWDVRSLTTSLGWDKHLNDVSTVHFGLRNYLQSRAFFFKEVYSEPETYIAVDSKLDRGFSNELEFQLTLQGHDRFDMPQFLRNDNIQFNLYFGLYHRHTATANWFSGKNDLISVITSIGVRYKF